MLDRSIKRRPEWIRHELPRGKNYHELGAELKKSGMATVCQEAKCPNISECWEAKTATMMILGDTCTRACKFCHVKTGNPKGFINSEEIEEASKLVAMMKLDYIVITSVDRDDLEDSGASHFAAVVRRINIDHPQVKVEVLIPDFDADPVKMKILAESAPFVVAQNMETVKRLTHPVRDRRASYEKTLKALEFYKSEFPHLYTKSSLMLGLGESEEELIETMLDLRKVGVDILTLGQYLQPSRMHLSVEKFYKPSDFDRLKQTALNLGFRYVASGPMVRSSYKASDYLKFLNHGTH
jgi:lipoyl synthase